MDSPDTPRRGRPRNPGPESQNIRIPGPLVPIVKALVAAWLHQRPTVFKRQPSERQVDGNP